jgi:predicted transcriptional regulator of viral defense system
MKEKGYYLAYSSAMYLLGLTDKPGTRIMMATERQRQPSVIMIKGAELQFVYHSYFRFFGYKDFWISKKEQAMVSDLEKTIVDAVSKLQLCGRITEVGKAEHRAGARTDLPKLFYYLSTNGNHAAKKHYLFLSDLLGMKWTSEHDSMLDDSRAGMSLLDPSGPVQGMKNSRFVLKINREVNSLKDYSLS